MNVVTNEYWVFYVNPEEAQTLYNDKVGKWMYFFGDKEFAVKVCKEAVENGIVAEAKHSNAPDGVCCFYLNCNDMVTHKRVIKYFIDNGLIRKTKAGKMYNISFKLDTQTLSGEYGSDFNSEIKLADFVNLETGEWIREVTE